ncbi:MAG: alpha-galactosidase, partial [Rhodobacteraceae bacterium]|nr:alpha-galactosidase [Paracoccaceae bacterium]
MQIWHFGCDRQSVVVCAKNYQLAQIVYWGPALPPAQDLSELVAATEWDVTGGMLDENPALSLCPTSATSFPGHPALDMRNVQGDQLLPRFNFVSADHGAHHLTLVYRDDALGVTYQARLGVDPDTHVLSAAAMLETQGSVVVNWFAAPVFPAPQAGDKIIDFSGRWIGEFQINQTDWSAGARLRDNRTGRTGHEHFPGAYLPCRGSTNTQGSVYAFHYATSCGHKMVAEELPDGRRQIQFGNATGTERMAKTVFETGTLYASYSDTGYNGCAIAFQRHLRDKVVTFAKAERPRPVHYNSWESVYFTHDLTVLKDIAKRAADL